MLEAKSHTDANLHKLLGAVSKLLDAQENSKLPPSKAQLNELREFSTEACDMLKFMTDVDTGLSELLPKNVKASDLLLEFSGQREELSQELARIDKVFLSPKDAFDTR